MVLVFRALLMAPMVDDVITEEHVERTTARQEVGEPWTVKPP